MTRKRCSWCGRWVSPRTPETTFPNWYGESVTQLHCPECALPASTMIAQNEAHLAKQEQPRTGPRLLLAEQETRVGDR